MGSTLFDKVWNRHVVAETPDGSQVLYIDRHYIHEVTSPQAFDTLRQKYLPLLRPDLTTATADHNVPTVDQHLPISDPLSREQVDALGINCEEFGVEYFGLGNGNQGIVHVIGPEQGLTRPGMTIVCGDSHTSTHGAFGCIAFGIGTSQVAQVFATQCLLLKKPAKMRITVNGQLGRGVSAKDIALYLIGQLTTAGGTGHFVEFAGEAINSLSMEGRMTLCNMSIEMGARGGMIAVDETTIDYLRDKPRVDMSKWDESVAFWSSLKSDPDAQFDTEYTFHASEIEPMITYGTNPGMALGVNSAVPDDTGDTTINKALAYMGFAPGTALAGKKIDHVFIGSCTNARIEDLRAAAGIVAGNHCAPHVTAMVIPGSVKVRESAIAEGLDKIFMDAGFEFREPGCSACLGMNEDKIPAGAYCVSTSNRNFEGRQGPGARTLLASPMTAAACAITGEITDVRNLIESYVGE